MVIPTFRWSGVLVVAKLVYRVVMVAIEPMSQVPPRVTRTRVPEESVDAASSASLFCPAQAHPPPRYT